MRAAPPPFVKGGLLALLRRPLSQSHAGAAAIFVDEFDAGRSIIKSYARGPLKSHGSPSVRREPRLLAPGRSLSQSDAGAAAVVVDELDAGQATICVAPVLQLLS